MAHQHIHPHELDDYPDHDHDHDHHHDHGHSHDHGHLHVHGGDNMQLAFFINLVFTIVEIFGGLFTNSLAILSDALHDTGDTVGLGLSWYFERLSKKGRTPTFSYGYRRFSILAALINATILFVGSIVIIVRAVPRIMHPEPVKAGGMLALAVLGILFNGFAVWRLRKSEGLNARVVRLHLLEDVLGWIAVLVGSIIIYFANVPVLDPILSMAIGFYVLFNSIRNLKAGLRIFLQAVPENISVKEISERLAHVPEVCSVHDVHLWTMEGSYTILTAHLVIKPEHSLAEAESIKAKCRHLVQHLAIAHATFEVETGEDCAFSEC